MANQILTAVVVSVLGTLAARAFLETRMYRRFKGSLMRAVDGPTSRQGAR